MIESPLPAPPPRMVKTVTVHLDGDSIFDLVVDVERADWIASHMAAPDPAALCLIDADGDEFIFPKGKIMVIEVKGEAREA